MSNDKIIRYRVISNILLIVATIMLLAAACIVFVPMIHEDAEMNRDTQEYIELNEATTEDVLKTETTTDMAQPAVTLVPPLYVTELTEDMSIQDYVQQGDEVQHVTDNTDGQTTSEDNRLQTVPTTDSNDSTGSASSSTADSKPTDSNAASSAATTTARDLKALKAQNGDFAGWLTIPGTKVDYPVVCSDNTDYYLAHTFDGSKSSLGTLFSLGKTNYSSSRNIAIYGHHITGSGQKMFKPLLSYKDKSFWAEHKTITLDTLSGKRTYTVFAVINMEHDEWDPSTADFISNDEYMTFINRAREQALFDTGISVSASDRILTLITCDRSYAGKDGRLIVMAVEQ